MYKSPLHQMALTTPTQFWNDNCDPADIAFAMEHGAVGATTNPVIVGQVLSAHLDVYTPLIRSLISQHPTASEDDLVWLVNEYMAVTAAKLFEPVFQQTEGRAGFVSIQTNTKYHNHADKTLQQALAFAKLAPNMMVKMPVTSAGVTAIEEATYHGVNVNATVSFSVAQALAVAEAVARGMQRRTGEGLSNSHLYPTCTLMVGRMDDWLQTVADKQGIIVDPQAITMSGVAVFKRAYSLYQAKGYHTRLLSAAYRHHHHWSAFIGGEISQTIPANWIQRFASSDITVAHRMDVPVAPPLIEQLRTHFTDFNRAYEPYGMTVDEFDTFGPTVKTLNQFLDGYDKMVALVRGIMLS